MERTRPIVEAVERSIQRGELPSTTDPALLSELLGGAILLRLFFGGETEASAIDRLVDSVVGAFGARVEG
jgi:hypothetical protein